MPLFYTLHKCKKILKQSLIRFQKKKHILSEKDRLTFHEHAEKLKDAIFAKKKQEAVFYANQVQTFTKEKLPKSAFDQVKEFIGAILFAIIVAFIIREFWFELYEVPTGSMRPTIEEQDRLIVSKTTFGLHNPFKNDLLLFNPDYIKRNGIIVFTVEDMDVSDGDTVYFYLFPGKKRYIKRCLGKPGDTLYFYGGRIYGIDKDKKEISELYDENILRELGLSDIEHIPYISFDGKTKFSNKLSSGVYANTSIKQMNQTIAKLSLNEEDKIEGHFFDGKEWIKDDPNSLKESTSSPKSYAALWGIRNYAMVRLLNTQETVALYGREEAQEGEMFLELHHTPNLSTPKPEIMYDEWGRLAPKITPFTTLVPLKKEHLEALQKALNTSRFYVTNGHAYRYTEDHKRPQPEDYDPLFPNIPNGCYEIEEGVAYSIHFGGMRKKLPNSHPIYERKNLHKFFNLGINFNMIFTPMASLQPFLPQRFAYFREGDLYVMGRPILKKEDPTLQYYVEKELKKEKDSSYIAFIDRGPPLKEGKIDTAFIEAFGLKIPNEGVLALGDNYAMSADSRDFGFVPTGNLRGAPTMIFWPFGSRFGDLPQTTYSFFIIPKMIIFVILILVAIFLTCFYYYRQSLSYYNKLIKYSKE